jgi:hypothetical protein
VIRPALRGQCRFAPAINFLQARARRWRQLRQHAMTAARGNQDRENCRMLEVRDELAVTAPLADAPEWTSEAAWSLYRLPFNDLLFKAQSIHRRHFDPNRVQLSKLLNIKTGGCPEDCGYCSQSSHHSTGLAASKLMDVEKVVAEARKAKAGGATRYCMARHGAIRSRETWMPSLKWLAR